MPDQYINNKIQRASRHEEAQWPSLDYLRPMRAPGL